MALEVERQSSKLIKPSIPTPETHRFYKIGFTDEFAPGVNGRNVFFFDTNTNHDPKFVARLEESLATTLTRFYPLAGRYVKENLAVDCSDQGADFIHAKVNRKLQDYLESEVNLRWGDEFMASEAGAIDQVNDPMLSVQLTVFECGGLAISISLSHRIADAATATTFLTEWAAMNRQENDTEVSTCGFNPSSIFPSLGFSKSLDLGIPRSTTIDVLSKYATKKLSFSESLISNFKAKAILNGNNGTHRRSKSQLVQAIIWKAFIEVDRLKHNYSRECILVQPINLRGRTASSIPKHSCGNICGLFTTESKFSETTQELAHLIKVSAKKIINDYSKLHHDSPEAQTMIVDSYSQMTKFPDSANIVVISSLCAFPFYEVDFGFGKPTLVTFGSLTIKNNAVLFDDAGGNGVEAFVCMGIEDVPYFEKAIGHINAFLAP